MNVKIHYSEAIEKQIKKLEEFLGIYRKIYRSRHKNNAMGVEFLIRRMRESDGYVAIKGEIEKIHRVSIPISIEITDAKTDGLDNFDRRELILQLEKST